MILVTLLMLGLSSSFLMQLKILVSTSFYPHVERARIQYLHAKLLRKRSKQPLEEVKSKLSGYLTKVRQGGSVIFSEIVGFEGPMKGGLTGASHWGLWPTSTNAKWTGGPVRSVIFVIWMPTQREFQNILQHKCVQSYGRKTCRKSRVLAFKTQYPRFTFPGQRKEKTGKYL